jgi:hypothetical protein
MSLPTYYPVANASRAEKLAWLDADPLPFERIREAAPWLMSNDEVRYYLDGMRDAMAMPDERKKALAEFFEPAFGTIIFPLDMEPQ